MLEINLQKIDKYYLGLSVILILMAVLVVFSFKGIFSAFLSAMSFDPSTIESQVRIDQISLDEAHEWAFNKKPTRLQVNQ